MSSTEAQGQWARQNTDEDLMMETAVLHCAIDVHPVKVTVDELTRELGGGSADFSTKDAVQRAIRSLAGVGLLHLDGKFVAPTRATLRFEELASQDAQPTT